VLCHVRGERKILDLPSWTSPGEGIERHTKDGSTDFNLGVGAGEDAILER